MRTAILLALALSSVVLAADPPAEPKTVGGFNGMLIVTPDKDWAKKWNTSPESIPYISSGSTVKKGGELYVITMFSNPQLDASGAASITMDIDVIRPDGKSSSHAENAVCVQGKVDPRSLHLCKQVVEYVDEPTDPAGKWSVRIVLKDDVRKVSIPLSMEFVVVDDRTKV
ncbi:MAG TPA: hypothetical protein VJ303_04515 [Steroidobacteraceae bacterium]|jgi:hypothetical protein|nr:hypothetical protein [Steroidobacteraceae bacterium]